MTMTWYSTRGFFLELGQTCDDEWPRAPAPAQGTAELACSHRLSSWGSSHSCGCCSRTRPSCRRPLTPYPRHQRTWWSSCWLERWPRRRLLRLLLTLQPPLPSPACNIPPSYGSSNWSHIGLLKSSNTIRAHVLMTEPSAEKQFILM